MKCILFAVLAMLATPCWSQTVYKCEDKNGAPIFSQQPCAADPAKVEAIEVRGNGKTDPEAAAAMRASEAEDFAARALQRTEGECINARTGSIYKASESRVRGYQSRIAQLERKMGFANNNLAGATYESGIRSEVAALQSSIGNERTTAENLASSARDSCADDRKRSEDRANGSKPNASK